MPKVPLGTDGSRSDEPQLGDLAVMLDLQELWPEAYERVVAVARAALEQRPMPCVHPGCGQRFDSAEAMYDHVQLEHNQGS